jgi:hypothetical protein
VKRKETMDILDEVHKRSETRLASINALEKALLGVMDLYTKQQQPAIEAFGAAMGEMIDLFAADGNSTILHVAGKTLISFAAARAANTSFVFNRTPENADAVVLAMAAVTKDMDAMSSQLVSAEERAMYAKARKVHDDMIAATMSMREAVLNTVRQNEILLEMNNRLQDNVKAISADVQRQQDDQDKRTVQIN